MPPSAQELAVKKTLAQAESQTQRASKHIFFGSADQRMSDKASKLPLNLRKHCIECGVSETPQWRQGPTGPQTLCNACGVRYSRLMRRQKCDKKRQAWCTTGDAEQQDVSDSNTDSSSKDGITIALHPIRGSSSSDCSEEQLPSEDAMTYPDAFWAQQLPLLLPTVDPLLQLLPSGASLSNFPFVFDAVAAAAVIDADDGFVDDSQEREAALNLLSMASGAALTEQLPSIKHSHSEGYRQGSMTRPAVKLEPHSPPRGGSIKQPPTLSPGRRGALRSSNSSMQQANNDKHVLSEQVLQALGMPNVIAEACALAGASDTLQLLLPQITVEQAGTLRELCEHFASLHQESMVAQAATEAVAQILSAKQEEARHVASLARSASDALCSVVQALNDSCCCSACPGLCGSVAGVAAGCMLGPHHVQADEPAALQRRSRGPAASTATREDVPFKRARRQ